MQLAPALGLLVSLKSLCRLQVLILIPRNTSLVVLSVNELRWVILLWKAFTFTFWNILLWIVRVHLRELYRKRGQSWGNPPPPPSVLSSPLFQNFLLAALIKILPHQPLKNVLHLLHRQQSQHQPKNDDFLTNVLRIWGGVTVNWPTCDDICLVRDRITWQEIWHFLPSEILIYQCK